MKANAWAGLAVLSILVCGTQAAILRVPADYATIQKGIDAAATGDTVLVAPGLYFEMINFQNKNITVTSTDPNDPGVVGYTIINAKQQGSVVTFKGNETSKAVLTGFTITGGTGTLTQSGSTYQYYYGGGIYCNYASPTIIHNVIVSNVMPYNQSQVATPAGSGTRGGTGGPVVSVSSYGGGIYSTGSPTIMYNTIYRNTAYTGGGIYCYGGTISNNLIYDNSAYVGGGVYYPSSYGRLTNNTIVGNDTSVDPQNGYAGNLYVYLGDDTASLTVANNIICSADSGGGVYWSGSARIGAMFRNNNVWGNAPYDYATVDSYTGLRTTGGGAVWTGRNGNIAADPAFDAEISKKYRLSDSSPCISAGDPNFVPLARETDIDGDPRVYALRVDIGADEHIGYVKPIAEAGPAQHVLTPQVITLNGTGSYVSDPNAGVSYHWTQTRGEAVQLDDPNAAQPTFTPPGEGWYAFQLVVSDGQYASEPDGVMVVVGNTRPVANAGPDKLWPLPSTVTLDGSRSRDVDPTDKLTYTWTQLRGPSMSLSNAKTARPTFSGSRPGIYIFRLVVSDGFTDSEPDTVKVEVAPFVANLVTQTVTATSSLYYGAAAGTSVVCAGPDTTTSSWFIYRNDPQVGEVIKYGSGTINTKPKVDGDVTVWVGGSGSASAPACTNICAASLATGTTVTTLQRATPTTSYGYPAIAGRTIVCLRHTNVNTDVATAPTVYANTSYDICGTDISDFAHPVSFTIATEAGHGMPYPYNDSYSAYEDYVDISGNLVVWEKDGDIYGADISDRSHINVFPICTAPGRQHDPSISGHTVVWTDERNDAGDIYGADVSDPNNVREFEVYVQSGMQCRPDIDGSFIVCLDGGEDYGNFRIFFLPREYAPVLVNVNQYLYGYNPSIHGSMIAWVNGNRISTARLDIAYALTNGPVQNLITGARYDTIQHAITDAFDGDTIVVPPGTYDERIRFAGKRITVCSTDPTDPNVRNATILKGDGELVVFADGEDSDSLFTGFTVSGSVGICCDHASPTITFCNATGCRDAGMRHAAFARPLVSRCDIVANGIGVEMATELFSRAAGYAAPTLQNCLIVGNRTYGVYGGDPAVSNCTVADNGDLGVSGMHPALSNSIVCFNNAVGANVKGKFSLAVSYSDVQGGAAGAGNLDVDPCFALRGRWVEGTWVDGDYHLASAGWRWSPAPQTWVWDDRTSPCIDAGDPAAPLGDENPCSAGDPLSVRAGPNTRIDMGAYGGTAEASLAPKP